jgi:predicted metal-dependent phosphoesterase TrpH
LAPIAAAPTAAPAPHGFWIPGDLHVHTIYGHDTCITPTTAWDYTKPSRSARRSCPDAYTWGFPPVDRLNEALRRGLGYVAITDHNNVVNQSDPAVLAWEKSHPTFVSIPGYENSQAGHVQMLGARSCYGNHGPTKAIIECDSTPKDKSPHGMQELADGLRRHGGIFQINHPSDMNWLHAYGRQIVPDTIEVWNIGPWAFQHPLPAQTTTTSHCAGTTGSCVPATRSASPVAATRTGGSPTRSRASATRRPGSM